MWKLGSIGSINHKGSQSWIFIERTDAEAETPILWPPDVKNWYTGKDPDAGKDWRREEKGMTEDEMVGWHHCLNGHEFEQVLRAGYGQGSLVCCNPWGPKESDTAEQLNWTGPIITANVYGKKLQFLTLFWVLYSFHIVSFYNYFVKQWLWLSPFCRMYIHAHARTHTHTDTQFLSCHSEHLSVYTVVFVA